MHLILSFSAILNIPRMNIDLECIFERIPFLSLSSTAGTAHIIVGRNSRMSPLQLKTKRSERVRGDYSN